MTQPQPRSQPLSTNSRKKRVLIIGAGPVGSLTALSLDKRGWEVEVWEGRTGESEVVSLLFLFRRRRGGGGGGGRGRGRDGLQ